MGIGLANLQSPASRLFSRRIIYHEALSEPIAQLLSDDPRGDVANPSRGEWEDKSRRLCWIFGLCEG